jgi:HlyD family secretion protein
MKRPVIVGSVSLLILVLLVWAFIPSPTEVEVATVTQGRFERTVQEDGKTRVRERYVISTPLTGRVSRIALKAGDAVDFDTPLAQLWPVAPALLDARTRAEQMARIGAMQSTLKRAQANVARSQAALTQARADLSRSDVLVQQGFVSPKAHESDQINVRLKEQELESVRQEAGAAAYDLAQSRAAIQQFGEPLRDARMRTFAIKAPISGTVLKVLQQSEGLIAAGTPLLELGNPRQLEVVVDILTEDAAQIRAGTAIQLSNWGGADVLDGVVRLIEPAAFTKVSALGVEEQRVNAVIDITTAPDQWRALGDGFKVDVRVLVQVVERAVKIPVSALFPVGSRSAFFVLEQGHVHQRETEVAARNGVDAWVKSGLIPGTQVVVYPDSKLTDGSRVTVRNVKNR